MKHPEEYTRKLTMQDISKPKPSRIRENNIGMLRK